MTVYELKVWLKDKIDESKIWLIEKNMELKFTDIGLTFVEGKENPEDEPGLFDKEDFDAIK